MNDPVSSKIHEMNIFEWIRSVIGYFTDGNRQNVYSFDTGFIQIKTELFFSSGLQPSGHDHTVKTHKVVGS